MNATTLCNRVLRVSKWPLIIGSMLLAIEIAPRLFRTLFDYHVWVKEPALGAATTGGAAYVAVWALWWRKCTSVEFWFTLEHEISHALASVVTANAVTTLNASESGNGLLTTRGEGNWLITSAPYWLPTVVIPCAVLLAFVENENRSLAFAFGFFCAVHIHSTYRETRFHQPDLIRLGRITIWCLLPAAHIIVAALLFSVATGNQSLIARAITDLKRDSSVVLRYIQRQIVNLPRSIPKVAFAPGRIESFVGDTTEFGAHRLSI